jgi:hypothetical protein
MKKIILISVFMFCLKTNAQTYVCPSCPPSAIYQPLNYFTFDSDLKDCMALGISNPIANFNGSNLNIQSGSIVNNCLRISGGTNKFKAFFPENFFDGSMPGGPITGYIPGNSKELTFEFAFRINSDSYSFLRFNLKNSAHFLLEQDAISFQLNSSDGNPIPNQLYLATGSAFTGNGKLSTNYLNDKQWHHIACTFSGISGVMRIWIDGDIITPLNYSFSNPSTSLLGLYPYEQANMSSILYNTCIAFDALNTGGSVDIDEVAFYNKELPDDLIYQHYLNITQHQHYTCIINPFIHAQVPIDPTVGPYDPLDYAPNHPFIGGVPATVDYSGAGSVPTVLNQIKRFPLARYKKNHGLNPNINWMDNVYLSRVNGSKSPTNDVLIQDELAKNWNYMFNLNPNAVFPSYGQNQLNAFANSHPAYKYSILTNMAQIPTIGPSFPTLTFLNDATCNSPSSTGVLAPNNTTENYYKAIGAVMRSRILTNVISDPITPLTATIDYVSENGFEEARFNLDPVGCPYNDPLNISTYNLWANPFTNYYEYYGYARKRLETAYKNEFISNSLVPNLTNAKFSKYLVSSVYENSYFEDYTQHRKLQTPYVHSGNINYYSTPPFYIRNSSEWKQPTSGTNWGALQIFENPYNYTFGSFSGRKHEIEDLHDSLFAPFIAAGWYYESNNVRPAQWLGLLKLLGTLGADFYHTGYFNVTDSNSDFVTGTTFPVDPSLWCYQAAMPSYAQANTSRFEPFLHSSSIYDFKIKNMFFYTIRKRQADSKYLIVGSQQQFSNLIGNAPNSSILTIDDPTKVDIDGLKFEIRKQGSTYIYNNANPSAPIFYQLDKWHENTHPYYWTNDFNFEAEVYDNLAPQTFSLVTERPASISTISKDFTSYTTFISFGSSLAGAEYIFHPRTNNSSYQVWVKLRKNALVTSTGVKIYLDGVLVNAISCITNTNWQWYGFESCNSQKILLNNVTNTNDHILKIEPIGNGLEFDQLSLKTNLNANLNTAVTCNSCTPSSIGKVICANNFAKLNASGSVSCKSINTFNWYSDSQLQNLVNVGNVFTTPILNSTTTYYLTFNNGVCNGPIVPVTVTVNPLPVVNAGVDIYTCSAAPAFNLSPSPLGGQWSTSPYLTSNIFNPSPFGAPLNTVQINLKYKFTDPLTGCKNVDDLDVYLVDHANLNAAIQGPKICTNSTAQYSLSTSNLILQNIINNANLTWLLTPLNSQPVSLVGTPPVLANFSSYANLASLALTNNIVAKLNVMFNCNGLPVSIGSKNIHQETVACGSLNKIDNKINQEEFTDKANSSIVIAPNPNNGRFDILFNNVEFERCSLVFTNVLGQIIKTEENVSPSIKQEFSINGDKGIYFLNIIVENKVIYTSKVIIK